MTRRIRQPGTNDSGTCGAYLQEIDDHHDTGDRKPSWYAGGSCGCFKKGQSFRPHSFLELELSDGQLIENYHIEDRGDVHTRSLARGKDGRWNVTG